MPECVMSTSEVYTVVRYLCRHYRLLPGRMDPDHDYTLTLTLSKETARLFRNVEAKMTLEGVKIQKIELPPS